jgi:hypothetical protein
MSSALFSLSARFVRNQAMPVARSSVMMMLQARQMSQRFFGGLSASRTTSSRINSIEKC